MICRVSLISHGLVLRLQSHQAHAPLLKYFLSKTEGQKQKSSARQDEISDDRVEVFVTLHDLFVDIQPVLTRT